METKGAFAKALVDTSAKDIAEWVSIFFSVFIIYIFPIVLLIFKSSFNSIKRIETGKTSQAKTETLLF
jgi:hypothetical protein